MSLGACQIESVKNLQLDFEGEKVVVLGYISNQQSVDVYVGKTKPILTDGNSEAYTSDAIINIYENNRLISTQSTYLGRGLYNVQLSEAGRAGQSYKLTVKTSVGNIEATSDPIPTEIRLLSANLLAKSNQNQLYLYIVSPVPNNDKQGYMIQTEAFKDNQRLLFYEGTTIFPTFGDLILYSKQNLSDTLKKTVTYSRIGFTLAQKSDTAKINKVKASLLNLSYNTVQFYKSLNTFEYNLDDVYTEKHPNVNNNIKGGYGFWGSYWASTKTILLK